MIKKVIDSSKVVRIDKTPNAKNAPKLDMTKVVIKDGDKLVQPMSTKNVTPIKQPPSMIDLDKVNEEDDLK